MGSYSFTRFYSAGFILRVCRFESSIFVVFHHQSEQITGEKPIMYRTKATSFKNIICSRTFLCLALISINLWRITSERANSFTRLWLKIVHVALVEK